MLCLMHFWTTMLHHSRPAHVLCLTVLVWMPGLLTLVNCQTCLKMTTFNAGLTPRIDDYVSRVSRQPAALLAEDSDVICLQEYWFEKDLAFMLDIVKEKYLHHYSPLHSSINTLSTHTGKRLFPKTACNFADVAYFSLRVLPCSFFKGCVPLFFKSLPDGLACLADKCGDVLKAFSEDCLSCITLTATKLTNMLDACKPEGLNLNNRFNGPGLVVLSKHEILSAKYKDYFPGRELVTQRGYIEAEIKDFGTVVCSHFSAVFPWYFEYDLNFSSYAQQQEAEIAVIHNKFSSIDHIVMADFNTGPQVESAASIDRVLAGEEPENYRIWLTNGYNITYMTDDGRCTFCGDNPLVDYNNNVLDYVMFKGDYTAQPSQRTLDTSPPLSDHYGVTRVVCKN